MMKHIMCAVDLNHDKTLPLIGTNLTIWLVPLFAYIDNSGMHKESFWTDRLSLINCLPSKVISMQVMLKMSKISWELSIQFGYGLGFHLLQFSNCLQIEDQDIGISLPVNIWGLNEMDFVGYSYTMRNENSGTK